MPDKKVRDKRTKAITTVGPYKTTIIIEIPMEFMSKTVCGNDEFIKKWNYVFSNSKWGAPTKFLRRCILEDAGLKNEKDILKILDDNYIKSFNESIKSELLEWINVQKSSGGEIYASSWNDYAQKRVEEEYNKLKEGKDEK